MNWKDIAISSVPFSRWYNPMSIMSISLLFLSTPQVFPKFILIFIPVKIRVSDFTNRTVWFWSPDMSGLSPDSSKFFRTCLVIYPDMSGLSAKNLKLNQNLLFWFISSTHLDLCDYVKILWCLKGEAGYAGGSFCHGLSLCDLEPSYCQLLKKGKRWNKFLYGH
jgi:hypothetical protein